MSDNDKNLPSNIDPIDFISNQFLSDVKGEDKVSSSMLEKIFLPHARVPASIAEEFVSSPEVAIEMLTAERPIYQTKIEQEWWKGESERGFNSINVDIFGAVCLADDRHLLDVIRAHGNLLPDAGKYTLREAAAGFGLKEVVWDYYGNKLLIDKPLLNRGVYYHITFSELCKAMNLQNQKKTRDSIITRLRRLSIMQLLITPVVKGQELKERSFAMSLVDKEFHLLLDKSRIRNGMFKPDTYTDLLVNVSDYYNTSLERDGYISRKRMLNHYPHLVGKNNIEDFYKSLDMHKREFVHGKYLSEMVQQYLDKKMSLFGINRTHKLRQIFQQIVDDRNKLKKHFNFMLAEEARPNICDKMTDYKIIHLDSLKDNPIYS